MCVDAGEQGGGFRDHQYQARCRGYMQDDSPGGTYLKQPLTRTLWPSVSACTGVSSVAANAAINATSGAVLLVLAPGRGMAVSG